MPIFAQSSVRLQALRNKVSRLGLSTLKNKVEAHISECANNDNATEMRSTLEPLNHIIFE
jgi:hypothetical protein